MQSTLSLLLVVGKCIKQINRLFNNLLIVKRIFFNKLRISKLLTCMQLIQCTCVCVFKNKLSNLLKGLTFFFTLKNADALKGGF